MPRFWKGLAIFGVVRLALAGSAWGQLATEEAEARLKARQAARATEKHPTSKPATRPATQPEKRPVVPDVIRSIQEVLKAVPPDICDFDATVKDTALQLQRRRQWIDQNTVGRKFSMIVPIHGVSEIKNGKVEVSANIWVEGPSNYKFLCIIYGLFDESHAEVLAIVHPEQAVILEGFVDHFEITLQKYHQGMIGVHLSDCRLVGEPRPGK